MSHLADGRLDKLETSSGPARTMLAPNPNATFEEPARDALDGGSGDRGRARFRRARQGRFLRTPLGTGRWHSEGGQSDLAGRGDFPFPTVGVHRSPLPRSAVWLVAGRKTSRHQGPLFAWLTA